MRSPDGRYMFGASKVGERGQIVIPKQARDLFNIKPGDMMLMLGDKNGIAMIKLDVFQDMADSLLSDILPVKAGEQSAANAEPAAADAQENV